MRELGRDILTIGRSPLNQIVIDHPMVSTQHAVLLRAGASYWLKDLDSRNGTRINGDFVTDAELKDGDTIRFGSVIAVFVGGYRKPCSSQGIRKFWMSIPGRLPGATGYEPSSLISTKILGISMASAFTSEYLTKSEYLTRFSRQN